jgi:hypothetical protein
MCVRSGYLEADLIRDLFGLHMYVGLSYTRSHIKLDAKYIK